jgi:hypothetical protein
MSLLTTKKGVMSVRRPCERTWREILEWAWANEVEEFTHNDLLREGVVNYRGDRRLQISSASSSLRQMWQAGLLTRLVRGKGRRASLYAPISREEYERKLRQLVFI